MMDNETRLLLEEIAKQLRAMKEAVYSASVSYGGYSANELIFNKCNALLPLINDKLK